MGLIESKEISRTTDADDKGVRSYTRTFRVVVDDPNEGPYSVASYVGINFGDRWGAGETDNTAYMRSASCRPVSGLNDEVWEVTFNYSNAPLDQNIAGPLDGDGAPTDPDPDADPGQSNQDVAPEDRPWMVSIDQVSLSVPLLYDAITGDPVTASNGQPYSPPFEVEAYRTQLTITGFKAIADDSYSNSSFYENKVNTATYWGFGADVLLVRKYALQSQKEHNSAYWAKTVVLEVNLEKWNPVKLLDQGTHYIPSDTSKPPQQILDLTGAPATSPMPLDGSGRPLSASEILAGHYHFREFNRYKRVSFSTLL